MCANSFCSMTLFQNNDELAPFRTFLLSLNGLTIPFMLVGVLPGDHKLVRVACVALLCTHLLSQGLIFLPSAKPRWEEQCLRPPGNLPETLRSTSCAILYYYRAMPILLCFTAELPLFAGLALEARHSRRSRSGLGSGRTKQHTAAPACSGRSFPCGCSLRAPRICLPPMTPLLLLRIAWWTVRVTNVSILAVVLVPYCILQAVADPL